jgi:hypothetical protein
MPTQGPTETPRPPAPAVANSVYSYPSEYLGSMVINNETFQIFQGINAPNGTLMLPSKFKGGAIYNNVIWMHRMWGTGWIILKIGDIIAINQIPYKVVSSINLKYGVYPNTGSGSDFKYIASCYSDITGWLGVTLYRLEMK